MKASWENGITTPDVPMMDMPPMTPTRGLNVFSAMRVPSATLIVTSTPSGHSAISSAVIILLGTGLTAGSPTSRQRPGNVTTPTPSPLRKRMMPLPFILTVAVILQPSVTSGSSPASFTTVALAVAPPTSHSSIRNRNTSPPGNDIATSSQASPSSSDISAPLAAAVAHEPVVKPLRNL